MRRTITTVLLAAGVLLTLTSCGTDGGTRAEPKPSKSTAYKLNPADQWRQSINAAGITSWTDDASPSTDELMAMPKDWCTALKDGHSVQWLLGDGGLYPAGDDWGTTKSEAQKLVVLGAEAYCPKQTGRVKAELRKTGGY
ncbi:hypothetical protein [Streptomyces sp. NRRL S-1521]|uniref:hypothetical protein n=1 Tax=Streptomyces sp. NRRL S-1521 TaxID=1609100 RepID=UPI00074A4747|nr:hypothetical protein [Streptomyces sp. NRRL S-1521]KUL62424.1 hypothetical protein ADL30_06000 [Streptomyces sp. NRRL S-1521]